MLGRSNTTQSVTDGQKDGRSPADFLYRANAQRRAIKKNPAAIDCHYFPLNGPNGSLDPERPQLRSVAAHRPP